MMLIHQDRDYKIHKEGVWVYVNDKRFGFTMISDDLEKLMVIHKRSIGRISKELGFYVPFPLAGMSLLFEMKSRNGKYVHYLYRPSKKQRLIKTAPDIFLSLCRMEITEDAQHITKPRG